MLVVWPAFTFAEEAAVNAAEPSNTLSYIIVTLVTAVVGWLGVYLRKKFSAEAEKAEVDKTKSLWEQRSLLIDQRLIPFLLDTGQYWLMTNIGPIMADVTDGGTFDWSGHLTQLKKYLRDRAVAKFKAENLDIVEYLGEGELENILSRVVSKVVAFLPKQFATLIPPDKMSKLVERASQYVMSGAPTP